MKKVSIFITYIFSRYNILKLTIDRHYKNIYLTIFICAIINITDIKDNLLFCEKCLTCFNQCCVDKTNFLMCWCVVLPAWLCNAMSGDEVLYAHDVSHLFPCVTCCCHIPAVWGQCIHPYNAGLYRRSQCSSHEVREGCSRLTWTFVIDFKRYWRKMDLINLIFTHWPLIMAL